MKYIMLSSRRLAALVLLLCGTNAPANNPYLTAAQTSRSSTSAKTPLAITDTSDAGQVISHGQQVFLVNCAFCHGSDGRGGEGGPNLLVSPVVTNDQNGELIAAIVLNGRPDRGMPKFELSQDNIAGIAAYLHSTGASQDHVAVDAKAVLVGSAAAGKAYFYGTGRCSECHSLKGDLAGIGAKYDPKTLQNNLISGGAVGLFGAPSATTPARTVSVTSPGQVITGVLVDLDDFNVTLTDASGKRRSFRRHGDSPRIDVVDPRQAHLDRLREWNDTDIHNLTAFLAKQK